MKQTTKSAFFGFFFLLIAPLAQSQDFKLSILAGVNFSQVNGDKLSGFDKIGIQAGAGIARKFSQKSEFSFEIFYSEKGSKDVVDANNPIQDTLFRFNYIDIPVIYSYYLKSNFKIQFGAYAGVQTKATYDDSYQEYDRSNQIRTMDYGITGGFEYVFSNKLAFNSRIYQSVLDINSFEKYYNFYIGSSVRYTL